ncbi:MAG: hypothetical protein AAB388_02470 [Patescibacteria group bacterium]
MNQTPSEKSTPSIPKPTRVILRIYGIAIIGFGLLSLIAAFVNSINLVNYVTSHTDLLLESYLLLLWTLTSAVMSAIYGYGVFRLERWTILPSCALAVNASLFLYIYTTLPNIYPVVGVAITALNILMIFVAISSIRYWSLFSDDRKKIKTVFGVIFIILLLPYILYGLANIFIRDYRTVNDSDLILKPAPLLSQDDNAHFYLPDTETFSDTGKAEFESAFETLRSVENDGLSAIEAKPSIVQTRNLTDAFILASKQKGYQCPVSINTFRTDAELCRLKDLRDLGALTALRSKVSFLEGDITDASESVLAVVRMAHFIEISGQSTIEYLVALSLYTMAAEPLNDIARHYESYNSHTSSTASSATSGIAPSGIFSALVNHSPDRANLIAVHKAEYMSYKNAFINPAVLKDVFGAEVKESYFWQPNRTTDIMAEVTRELIDETNLNCEEETAWAAKVGELVYEANPESIEYYIRPNFLGRLLLSTVVGGITDTRDRMCTIEQTYGELKTRFENL